MQLAWSRIGRAAERPAASMADYSSAGWIAGARVLQVSCDVPFATDLNYSHFAAISLAGDMALLLTPCSLLGVALGVQLNDLLQRSL